MTDIIESETGFLYGRVARLVTSMIEKGTLEPGDRVPSLRRLSRELRVSISTVSQAYLSLEEQGTIESRPQSGFYVKRRAVDTAVPPAISKPANQPRVVRVNDMIQTMFSSARDPAIVPLGIANPAPELLPLKGLARCMRQVATRHPRAAVNYTFSPGNEELRRLIALRGVSQGGHLTPDDVVITSGATEALAVALQAVARPGDVIAVESPTYFSVLQLIEQLGMLALEVPTDPSEGMDLDSLEERLADKRVKAVISVGNFANPTGALMPDASKRRLVEMLSERQIPLIEDDINGELFFSDLRPANAKRFDTDGWVLSCASFSKTLAPGYRVGWVLPGRFKDAVIKAKQVSTSATASLPQLAIAEFLRTGSYDRHLRRLRTAYREQVECVRNAVGESFPNGTRITRPQGGMVLWIELPRGVDSVELFSRALAVGVGMTPGPLFSPTRKFKNYLRLACGKPWDDDIARGVRSLADLATRMLD